MEDSAARIVVIEDHPEHLDYLATLLRRAGYVVAAFERAPAALDHIRRCPVELIITDVFMPEMDGFEVLKAVQKMQPQLPLIAVSGAGSRDRITFLRGMINLGARAVFTKPLDSVALLSAIAGIFAGNSGA